MTLQLPLLQTQDNAQRSAPFHERAAYDRNSPAAHRPRREDEDPSRPGPALQPATPRATASTTKPTAQAALDWLLRHRGRDPRPSCSTSCFPAATASQIAAQRYARKQGMFTFPSSCSPPADRVLIDVLEGFSRRRRRLPHQALRPRHPSRALTGASCAAWSGNARTGGVCRRRTSITAPPEEPSTLEPGPTSSHLRRASTIRLRAHSN